MIKLLTLAGFALCAAISISPPSRTDVNWTFIACVDETEMATCLHACGAHRFKMCKALYHGAEGCASNQAACYGASRRR